jgi:hypothetical protein
MTFTTPCFVRVENPEKRKELIEWLNNIGRRPTPYSESDRSPWFTAYATGRFCQTNGFHMHPEMAQKNGYINCGKNIELFKALAAMNYENNREQWFVEEGKMFKCTSDKINNYCYHWLTTRKATAEEIVEYFKNKER